MKAFWRKDEEKEPPDCPVCNGTGQVKRDGKRIVCPACRGSGKLWVLDEDNNGKKK